MKEQQATAGCYWAVYSINKDQIHLYYFQIRYSELRWEKRCSKLYEVPSCLLADYPCDVLLVPENLPTIRTHLFCFLSHQCFVLY